jgi:predicted enzyme related to lactoylglutathione lyase
MIVDDNPEAVMSRVQLALNVVDVAEAAAFYSKLFATPPAKLRPGYANFAVEDPPLKLVLIEDPSCPPGSLNHLGVEVATAADVMAARERLSSAGLATVDEEGVTCCYALQDKVWVEGAGGERWEVYTVLADADARGDCTPDAEADEAVCCAGGTEPPGAAG